jgi:hypothetical protein
VRNGNQHKLITCQLIAKHQVSGALMHMESKFRRP